MSAKLLKGVASPANCARKIPGPFIVFMINLPSHGLARKAQSDFPSGQKYTEAGIKPAFLLAGDLRTSFIPLPSKTARTDCARDLSKKGRERWMLPSKRNHC
jgi:hypothetical protein